MDIRQLAGLIATLEDRLRAMRQDEAIYQTWFEQNPEVFQALQLSNPIAHPIRVTTETGDTFVPDFLVCDLTGIWTIFELKRPDTPILKTNKGRRIRFYDEFESYHSQCREYSRFFQDSTNRRTVLAGHGIDVQPDVPSIIVAGRDSAVDKKKVHELLFGRVPKVSLYTYDDVLAALKGVIRLQESHLRNLPGITLSMLLVLHPAPSTQEQYLYDFGLSDSRDRISIGTVGADSVFVRIRDSNGKLHAVTVPFSLTFLGSGKLIHLHFEIGLADDFLFLTVLVNGRCLLHREYDALRLNPDPFEYWVTGSDVHGKTPAFYAQVESILYGRTLSFEERVQLQEYFYRTYCYYFSPLCTALPNGMGFLGHKWMHIRGHPNFSGGGEKAPLVKDLRAPLAWYIADKGVSDQSGRLINNPDPHKTQSAIGPPGTPGATQ